MNLPHCDLSTGIIYGCKKGSWKWYHEKAHLIFNQDERKSFLILFNSYIRDIWVFFIMVSIIIKQLIFAALGLSLVYLSIWIYEEWWCNSYANNHYKTKNLK